ncbi:protein FAR1-RELATED SEQUENCE 4-like [Cucumis melo var. makuwa]|uniref:Protein FAR1-RELATED SEQUENCE 4-like n=1 Tax=Cucumis melo var. makuwa TaxID=1194695 RepID=A0A5A7V9M9_CUCMM|nr:protein FAR1-RELATED SEQUENCE 4-like [Cucumis melo var. makuwa]
MSDEDQKEIDLRAKSVIKMRMSIPIVIFYGGQWNGCNVYENYSVSANLVDMRVNFNSLVALTCEQLELYESVELFVLLDFGKSNVQIVVSIKKDNDVAWYLAFAKDATSVSISCPYDFRFMSTDRSIPKDIVHKARTNLGVNISYQKAWRAKEHMVKILHGDIVESYMAALEMDDSGHFKFCFMAFGESIEGWKYCRSIISVDETFLKYSENDASWTWFFEKIRSSFSERANLVIVSDRHL